MTEKQLLVTHTGEYIQPVRLHYQVFDHTGLLRAFQSLRCLRGPAFVPASGPSWPSRSCNP